MLEIIILYKLCSNLGGVLRHKSRSAIGYQILLVFAWFLAEFLGAGAASFGLFLIYGRQWRQMAYLAYIASICSAVFTAFAIFQVVKRLPCAEPEQVLDAEAPGDIAG